MTSPRVTRHRYTARRVDPHDLYEKSVQDPEPDIHLLDRWFLKERGRKALRLREDFCGTSIFCAKWLESDERRTAVGVDLDRRPMAWGKQHHFKPANPDGADLDRMIFARADVRTAKVGRADLTVAFNFSWCVFQERRALVDYFRAARAGLVRDGLFALDIHGGPESLAVCKDERRMGGFTYVWDQTALDPITHRSIRKIHFEFPDGSARRNVYRYDWRVWMLPETREALQDAGFARVDILWELFDGNGEGSGVFRRTEHAKNEDSWVAYLMAWK